MCAGVGVSIVDTNNDYVDTGEKIEILRYIISGGSNQCLIGLSARDHRPSPRFNAQGKTACPNAYVGFASQASNDGRQVRGSTTFRLGL